MTGTAGEVAAESGNTGAARNGDDTTLWNETGRGAAGNDRSDSGIQLRQVADAEPVAMFVFKTMSDTRLPGGFHFSKW